MNTTDIVIPDHTDWQCILHRLPDGCLVHIFRNEAEKVRWDREQAEMLEEALRMNF